MNSTLQDSLKAANSTEDNTNNQRTAPVNNGKANNTRDPLLFNGKQIQVVKTSIFIT